MWKTASSFHSHFVTISGSFEEQPGDSYFKVAVFWFYRLFCPCQFLRFSTFPWMYLLAGILKDAERAFITYVCINLFISVNTILSTSILYFLGQIASRNVEVCINSLLPNAVVIATAYIRPVIYQSVLIIYHYCDFLTSFQHPNLL